MSIESDAASQITGIYTQGIQAGAQVAIRIGGETFRLAGEGIKRFLDFIAKVFRQEDKNGKLLLCNMLKRSAKEGRPLSIFRINSEEEYKTLAKELKSYGVTYSKARGRDCWDILIYADDAPRINQIIEKNGLNSVQKVTDNTAEKVDVKEENFSDKYNEQDIPIKDDDIIEYKNADELTESYFAQGKELHQDIPEAPTAEPSDPYADSSYYDKHLPFDDNDIIEYKDADALVNDYFSDDKNKNPNDKAAENQRGAKEQEVPTKAEQSPQQKSQNHSDQKSKDENGKGKNKRASRKEINRRKAEHMKRSAEATSKSVQKAVRQEVKAK